MNEVKVQNRTFCWTNVLMRCIACLIPYAPWRKKVRNFFPLIILDRYIRKIRYKVEDYQKIPIFIISFNRLECLRLLVLRLESMGYSNIHIIDNNSTYPPLLAYLKNSQHKVYFLSQNMGHLVLWKNPIFTKIIQQSFYVVTDPDIMPIEECPADFLQLFYTTLCKNLSVTKVGFSLKLDDIPKRYKLRDMVLEWESRSYKHPFKRDGQIMYRCGSDTTFALYRPQRTIPTKHNFFSAIRIGFPYQIRHLPWYKDFTENNDEDLYYTATCEPTVSTWSGRATEEEIKLRFGM